MTTNRQDWTAAYHQERAKLNTALVLFQKALESHAAEQQRQPENWDFVRDLKGHVRRLCEQLAGFQDNPETPEQMLDLIVDVTHEVSR